MAWFDCANRRPISNNMGGTISQNLGLILHHQAGNGSLFAFFNNPASQVSAHFWVSKSGIIEQYVDSTRVAWHGRSLNSRYVGVETEGCPVPPYAEPLTSAQINGLALIYQEGNRRHGWQWKLANADGQPGFGYHRMAVATGCPCDIRLEKRSEILQIAQGNAPTPPIIPPVLSNLGDTVFIRQSDGRVFWLIYDGPRSYWRQIPAGLVQNIPPENIIPDPNGSWLQLWNVGAPN